MKYTKPLIGFSFFVVLTTVLTYTIWSTLQRSVAGETSSYSAVFTDVLGLRVGDDVRMAGVRVGRVDKIDFTPEYTAEVDFRIEARQHLTDTTKALVRYQNLIGQRYLALAPGEAAPRAGEAAPEPVATPAEEPAGTPAAVAEAAWAPPAVACAGAGAAAGVTNGTCGAGAATGGACSLSTSASIT